MRITFDMVKEANVDLPDTHDWAFVDGKLECYARSLCALGTNFKVAILWYDDEHCQYRVDYLANYRFDFFDTIQEAIIGLRKTL